MSSDTPNWWQRIVSRLKPSPTTEPANELPAVGKDGLLIEPAESAPEDGPNASSEKQSTALGRWAKRDLAITRLQEGYDRVNQLIADMQKHMADQSERTDRMCSAIEQLSQSMAKMPAVSTDQTRTLQSILGQLETANNHNRQLTTALEEIPKVTKSHYNTLSGINRQLEMMTEQDIVSGQNMERLGGAIQTLGQHGGTQTDLLKEMNIKMAVQNERLGEFVTTNTRRFVILFIAALILAVTGIVIGITAVMLRG